MNENSMWTAGPAMYSKDLGKTWDLCPPGYSEEQAKNLKTKYMILDVDYKNKVFTLTGFKDE